MGRQQQMIAIQWYNDMTGQEEKICIIKNITYMMEEQLNFFRKKAGLTNDLTEEAILKEESESVENDQETNVNNEEVAPF